MKPEALEKMTLAVETFEKAMKLAIQEFEKAMKLSLARYELSTIKESPRVFDAGTNQTTHHDVKTGNPL